MYRFPFKCWDVAIAAIVITILTLVEPICFLPENSVFRRIAGISWLTITCGMLLGMWLYSLTPFFNLEFWKDRNRIWFLIAFIAPIFLTYVDIWGIYFSILDGEGVHQLRDARLLLQNDNALGIYNITYYQYPGRQYLINYLPTLLIGPSLTAIRVGTTMFGLGGCLFLATSLRAYLIQRNGPDSPNMPTLLASFACATTTLGYIAIIAARKFEQEDMPVGAMASFLGAFLLYKTRRTPFRFMLLFWGIGIFSYVYTPALAGLFLCLGILGYLVVTERRWDLFLILGYGILTFGVSAYISRDLVHDKFRIGIPDMTLSDWSWRWFQAISGFMSVKQSILPAPLSITMAAGCYLSLRHGDFRLLLVFLWGIATVTAAYTFTGYNFDSPFFASMRTVIILPVFAVASVLVINKYLFLYTDDTNSKGVVTLCLYCFIVYMFVTGVQAPFLEEPYMPLGDRWNFEEPLIMLNEINWNKSMAKPVKVYIVPPLDCGEELIEYFCPGIPVINSAPPKDEKIKGAYIFSLIDPTIKQHWDLLVPSRHQRPFVKMETEQ